ncbi:MAG: 50S ribosomal protein L17 [Patescibacteria group bacterium]
MKKQVFGRKFKRDKNERKALFSGLISAMILRGRISTTEQKAKAVKPSLDKLVTKAKKKEARRLLQSDLKPFEIDKMINVIAPGFKNRKGGYTRIIRSGVRFNDNASMVIMEWSEMQAVEVKSEKLKVKSDEKKDTKEATKKSSVKTARKPARKTTRKANK